MIVDCMTCPVRAQRCDGCVVTVLLAPGSVHCPLDAAESRAVSMFVGAALVGADTAARLQARREPLESADRWGVVRAVG